MAELKACIVGLGETGTSLGLALKAAKASFHVMGHDRNRDRMAIAQRLKAVDKTAWNIHKAVEPADLVILTVPHGELKEMLPLLAETFRPQSLVFILGSALAPAQALASEHLPDEVSYVLGHPILTGIKAPVSERADLFQDGLFCLVPGPETSAEALQIAHNLVQHIGGIPHYLDVSEHDGLIAGVAHAAHLLAAAYMHSAATGAGWQDARKLAGRIFYNATDMTRSPEQLGSTLWANREYVQTWLGILQRELADWQDLLQAESAEPLLQRAEEVYAARQKWEREAALQDWSEDIVPDESTSTGGMVRQMFLGGLGRRRKLPDPDPDSEAPKS